MRAIQGANIEVIEIVLKEDIDMTAQDADGKVAMDYAESDEIIAMIKEKMS